MYFRINNVQWSIQEISQKEIKQFVNLRSGNEEKEDIESLRDRYYGITYSDLNVIYLDQDLPKDRKRKVLMHELAHCYIVSNITHQEMKYNEEFVADIIANSFDFVDDIVKKYF